MKKLGGLLLAMCFSMMVSAQEYQVGTAVEKKNVLLEVYTGIHCAWCSQGDQVSERMKNVLPGDAFVIDLHTGGYATPSAGEPDYRTDEADALCALFDVTGFPSGVMNRHDWSSNEYITSRAYWIDDAQSIVQEDSKVNLFVNAKYDGDTRLLTVHVEGYYTANPSSSDQRLTVALTQDGIIGPQNGASKGDEYEHNNMLRDYLTEQWGDELGVTAAGQYFSKDYTYSLPEDYKDIAVKPEDLNIIAFVTDGKYEVQQVESVKPEYVNYGQAMNGELFEPSIPVSQRYGYNFFELKLRNRSAHHITTATFDVTVNGETQSQTIDTDLAAYEKADVKIPANYSFVEKGRNKFEVKLTALNGEAVEAEAYSGSFTNPKVGSGTLLVQIMTDNCASQNHFYLKDADGNIVKEFGPYADGVAATYYDTIQVADQQVYCFEITDSYGDGLNEGKRGGILVHDAMGSLIAQYYQINDYGTRAFFRVDEATGIQQLEQKTISSPAVWYNLQGQRLGTSVPTQAGLYLRSEGGKTTKITIK